MRRIGTLVTTLAAATIQLAPAVHAAVFWGDVHAHSGLSNDATGTPDGFFTVARDVVGLDFVVLSDHDVLLTPNEWDILRATAASFNQDGLFVAFSALEWTRAWHMNVYFLGDDEPICTGCNVAQFNAVYGGSVLAGEAAAHVNHPVDPPYPVTWHTIDDLVTTNVEVWNSGALGEQETGFGGALWALRAGFRLGLVGVSDDHHTDQVPRLMGTGLTGCHAAALTRADLLAALRDRRCFATNGDRTEVDLDVDGTAMGGERAVPIGSAVTVTLTTVATDTPATLELLRDGAVVASKTDCVAPACTLSAPVTVTEQHTFFYGRVRQTGGRVAWTSPVWVEGQCIEPDDCPLDRLASGGRSRERDCLTEWSLRPGPDLNSRGRPRDRVTCVDGDPACDFGAAVGECTFRVGLCFGVSDSRLPDCIPAAVSGYELLHPAESSSGADLENRLTLLAALQALGPAPAAGACTPLLDLNVPLDRGPGPAPRSRRRTLRGRALSATASDRDRLELICKAPGGS